MKRLIAAIEKLSVWGAFLSATFMIFIVALILVEIVLRAVFNTSALISNEYSAYFFVGTVLLGLAYTLKEKGHIKIMFITSVLSRRGRAILNVLTTLIAIAITSYALYHASLMVYDSWQLGIRADSISETPVFLSQLAIPIGLLLLDLQLMARILRRLL